MECLDALLAEAHEAYYRPLLFIYCDFSGFKICLRSILLEDFAFARPRCASARLLRSEKAHSTLLKPTVYYYRLNSRIAPAKLCFQYNTRLSQDSVHQYLLDRRYRIGRLYYDRTIFFLFFASELALDITYRLLILPALPDFLQEGVPLTLPLIGDLLIKRLIRRIYRRSFLAASKLFSSIEQRSDRWEIVDRRRLFCCEPP